jgi:hypothetical protein
MNVLKGNLKIIDMNKKEQIINTVTVNGCREWTDARVNQAMDEYAEYVAKKAWTAGYYSSDENNDLNFKEWFEQFKAKQDG